MMSSEVLDSVIMVFTCAPIENTKHTMKIEVRDKRST
jgi:hypothetical protein